MINPRPFRTSRPPAPRAGPVRAPRRRLAGAVVAGLIAVAGAAAVLAAPAQAVPPASGSRPCATGHVDYFELTGVIDQVSAQALNQQISAAEAGCSDVLVVRLDTPGGLTVSVSSLVNHILSSTVPIVMWVAPQGARAAGAGVFLATAASLVVMAPGTSLGPVAPVNLDARPASAAPAMAALRQVAAERGRSSPLPGPSATISDAQAAQSGFAAFQAGELGTLLQNLPGRRVTAGGTSSTLSVGGAGLRFHKMSVWARLVHSADRPAVAYMLVLLGLFGLVFELYFPGIGAAGLMGGAALGLGLYGFSILPTSWLALCLVVVGVCLFVPDLHMGGLGVFTGTGTLALLVGSIFLLPRAQPALALPWWAIVAGVAGTLVFFISVMTAAMRSRFARPPAGAEGLLGGIGIARTDLAPDGEVTADGALWRARTLGAAIAEGSRVRVRSVSGLLLLVEPLDLEDLDRAGPASGPDGLGSGLGDLASGLGDPGSGLGDPALGREGLGSGPDGLGAAAGDDPEGRAG
jgi:membrane-bound serine protease (ClpP class)